MDVMKNDAFRNPPAPGKRVFFTSLSDAGKKLLHAGFYASKHKLDPDLYFAEYDKNDLEYDEEQNDFFVPEGWYETPVNSYVTMNLCHVENVIEWFEL